MLVEAQGDVDLKGDCLFDHPVYPYIFAVLDVMPFLLHFSNNIRSVILNMACNKTVTHRDK